MELDIDHINEELKLCNFEARCKILRFLSSVLPNSVAFKGREAHIRITDDVEPRILDSIMDMIRDSRK
jgi:hypothetical protein